MNVNHLYFLFEKNMMKSLNPQTMDFLRHISRVQMKSWTGKALETVNSCAFLKRRLTTGT
jgi:hypothetical protein